MDCIGDCPRLTGKKGVLSSHDALKAGKFSDHTGHKIGLAQKSHPINRSFDLRLQRPGQKTGQGAETHHLFVGGPQFRLENDLFEILNLLLQGNLRVFTKEKAGIGKPGA